MKKRYEIARKIATSGFVRQKYLRSIIKLFIPTFDRIENEPFEVDFYNLKIRGELDSFIDWEIFFLGSFDRFGLTFIKKILTGIKNPVCIDIGGNIGNHTLFMSQFASKVLSFEPLPDNFKKLERNIQINNLQNVKLYDFGLSNIEELIPFYENKEKNAGAGSFVNRQNVEEPPSLLLKVKMGDSVLPELEKIDFIKIDVEEYELEVIEGMQEILKKYRPIVMMEFIGETPKKFINYDNMKSKFPNNYYFKSLKLFKYKGIKRFLDTEYLELDEFDFNNTYEHILICPEEKMPA